MSSRKIASSTLWQIASQLTMAALSIITVKFVAIGLSKELAGIYNSAYGFLQLFGILADFGLYAVAVKEISKAEKREEVLGAIIILRCITLVISLAAALILVWAVPAWKGTPLPLSVAAASLVPFFTLLAGVIRTVFQVNYKMHFVFIAEVSQRILTVLLFGLLIFLGVRGSNDLDVLYTFLLFGGAGAFLLFSISLALGNRLMPIRPNWDSALLKKLAFSAAPFGLAYLCMALYRQFDVTLIALLRPDFELQNAYYGFVLRMTDMGFLVPTFILNSVLPALAMRDAHDEDTKNLLGKTLFALLILGSVSFLFSALWPRPLVQLLTTDAYLSTPDAPGSDTALKLLSIPMFLNGIVLFGFYILLVKHKWKMLVLTLLFGAAASIALNMILIPRAGFIGAAITSAIIHVILSAALIIEARRTIKFQLSLKNVLQWLVFSALLGAGLRLLRPALTGELMTMAGLAVMGVYIGFLALMLGYHKLIQQE